MIPKRFLIWSALIVFIYAWAVRSKHVFFSLEGTGFTPQGRQMQHK